MLHIHTGATKDQLGWCFLGQEDFFHVMPDEYYATRLGRKNPPPASACNAANSAWGRPQRPALSTLAMLSSQVHREMNFNYKVSHTDSTLLPCS